jgi:hypothetical protein
MKTLHIFKEERQTKTTNSTNCKNVHVRPFTQPFLSFLWDFLMRRRQQFEFRKATLSAIKMKLQC